MDRPDFIEFPKIARFSREVIVTEKIDGTNAQVVVSDDGTQVWAASRTRFITAQDDNFGFARWVDEYRSELLRLGPGRHFGEWWGRGIQRGYGLMEKRFSLFNVSRWSDPETRPTCCGVVPELWRGLFDDLDLDQIIQDLRKSGSRAAPGFMKPEGVVIYHVAGGHLYKKTLEKDEVPKGARKGSGVMTDQFGFMVLNRVTQMLGEERHPDVQQVLKSQGANLGAARTREERLEIAARIVATVLTRG